MPDKKEIEVWIVMDSDGDYCVGGTDDQAIEDFNENVGTGLPRLIVKLKVHMAPPVIAEVTVEVPDTAPAYAEAAAVMTSTSTMTERQGA